MRRTPQGRPRRWATVAAGTVALAVAAAGVAATGAGRSAAAPRPATTTADPFDAPSGLAWADGHLWVSNEDNSTLTEVNAATGGSIGTVVRTVQAGANGLDHPAAVLSTAGELWVADEDGSVDGRGSVSELEPGDGALIRTISSSRFDHPVALRADGTTLLVLSQGQPTADPVVAGSLTEIDTIDGHVTHTISGTGAAFDDPTALGLSGQDAWITDKGSNAVTEVDVATATRIRTITGGGLHDPKGIATDGSVWVADSEAGGGLTQINSLTGAVEHTWTDQNADYGFNDTSMVVASGPSVYVATPFSTSPMVTNVPVSDPGVPAWYMCNTNGPYYFSALSAFVVSGADLWVASRTGANWQGGDASEASTGSLTELVLSSGALVGTMP